MPRAVFPWTPANGLCMCPAAFSLLTEADRSYAPLEWRVEGWGQLVDQTGNKTTWRRTVNRCLPCVRREGCKITEHALAPLGRVGVSVSLRVFLACVRRPECWWCVTEWDWRSSKFLHFCGESCQLFTFRGLSGPGPQTAGPS